MIIHSLPFIVAAWVIASYFLGKLYRKHVAKLRHTDVPHFLLNESHHNSIIAVPPNSGIVLTLRDAPSTGYQWQIVDPQDHIIKMLNNGQHLPIDAQDENGEWSIGGQGKMLWRFWAHTVGVHTLKMRYRRPWESFDDHSFEYQVTIAVVAESSQPEVQSCNLGIC